jgi:molybdenum cofactor guanylyltransferase
VSGLAAIILAGGRSQRMGRDKAAILWAGRSAVERLAGLARAAGAERVVVSGGDHGLPFVRDPTPFGGPVGGLLAAAEQLANAERLLVLAVDAPTVLRDDLRPLLSAPEPGACYLGYPLPMVLARCAIPTGAAPGMPLRRFVERAGLRQITPLPEACLRLRGANTPAELQELIERRAREVA